jgi:hypothetical protein
MFKSDEFRGLEMKSTYESIVYSVASQKILKTFEIILKFNSNLLLPDVCVEASQMGSWSIRAPGARREFTHVLVCRCMCSKSEF